MNYYNPHPDKLNHWQRHACQRFADLCQPRAKDSHKGSFGTVGIVGGSSGMTGALVLAGTGALKSGCGKVWLGFAQNVLPLPVLPQQPEVMLGVAHTLLKRSDIDVWAVGCGLGTDTNSSDILTLALTKQQPIILDADALNIMAIHPDWQPSVRQRTTAVVITPHMAEAARLLQCSLADIQANRHQAAHTLATQWNAWVVLKGHQTLVASPQGHIHQNISGNPGLATAGSGDVLSGMLASLLAQGLNTQDAILGAVWLHGAAADVLVASGIGPIGLTAGELADAARWLRNQLTNP